MKTKLEGESGEKGWEKVVVDKGKSGYSKQSAWSGKVGENQETAARALTLMEF